MLIYMLLLWLYWQSNPVRVNVVFFITTSPVTEQYFPQWPLSQLGWQEVGTPQTAGNNVRSCRVYSLFKCSGACSGFMWTNCFLVAQNNNMCLSELSSAHVIVLLLKAINTQTKLIPVDCLQSRQYILSYLVPCLDCKPILFVIYKYL